MNAYEVLQVSQNAPAIVIRAAWSALIRECHPDGPKPNEKRTRELNEAYAILKDPKKRAALDQHIKAQRVKAAARHPHSPESAYPEAYEGFSPEKIDDAIEELTRAANATPIVGDFLQFLHHQARKK